MKNLEPKRAIEGDGWIVSMGRETGNAIGQLADRLFTLSHFDGEFRHDDERWIASLQYKPRTSAADGLHNNWSQYSGNGRPAKDDETDGM